MIEVNTTALDAFAVELRAAGAELRGGLEHELAEVGTELREAVRGSLVAGLPRAGGLNRGAAERVRVSTTPHVGAEEAGVAVVVSGVGLIDDGVVRHPTYGHDPQVTQHITPGLISHAIETQEPAIEARAEASVDLTLARLEGTP